MLCWLNPMLYSLRISRYLVICVTSPKLTVSSTGMPVSLLLEMRFPTAGQMGHEDQIIQEGSRSDVKNGHKTSGELDIMLKWKGRPVAILEGIKLD